MVIYQKIKIAYECDYLITDDLSGIDITSRTWNNLTLKENLKQN